MTDNDARPPILAQASGQPAIERVPSPRRIRRAEQDSSPPTIAWPWLLSNRGVSAAVAAVATIGVAGLIEMWLIANRLHGAGRATLQIDAIKYGLGFIAAGGALAALLLSVRRQLLAERGHQLELQKQNLELRKQTHAENDAAERRVTELFTKAVEQLGSPDAAVRLGSLYALERVAQNNVDQRQTIVDVICAYLRMPYTPPTEPPAGEGTPPANEVEPAGAGDPTPAGARDPRQELQVRLTAQRILTTHLRRPSWLTPQGAMEMSANPAQRFWPAIDLDLGGAVLVDWDLSDGIVRRSDFRKATFSGDSTFSYAAFSGTTSFARANFVGTTWFAQTNFFGTTSFEAAAFAGTTGFGGATFSGTAQFEAATFSGNISFDTATFSANASFVNVRIPRRPNRYDMWPTGWAAAPRAEFNTLVRQPRTG